MKLVELERSGDAAEPAAEDKDACPSFPILCFALAGVPTLTADASLIQDSTKQRRASAKRQRSECQASKHFPLRQIPCLVSGHIHRIIRTRAANVT